DIAIRSTFIAGFPGETEEEFEALLDFVRRAQIDRVGCFAYSPVRGAAANELPGALPDELRAQRQARFMEVAEQVSVQRLRARIGQDLRVLVDQAGRDGASARSYAEAPEIDGKVLIAAPAKPSARTRLAQSTGQFLRARVVGTRGHDLLAELI
ncbi:MAG: 30S ribosomal protein S12 methylthiotransferase RimO, partial [Betaproteobacteria bacterium]|nr:30S ribosomal protein S12 methylthiotransferase RimO [Betaproteobacteria bacterium]